MINTPLPVSFANNKGLATSNLAISNNIPIHKASLRTYELPLDTVCIKHNNYATTYRYNYGTRTAAYHSYAQILAYGGSVTSGVNKCFEFSGGVESFDDYIAFTQTVNILHPLVMQLFSR